MKSKVITLTIRIPSDENSPSNEFLKESFDAMKHSLMEGLPAGTTSEISVSDEGAELSDGWIEVVGNTQPVPDSTIVEVRFADGSTDKDRADAWQWSAESYPGMQYRLA